MPPVAIRPLTFEGFYQGASSDWFDHFALCLQSVACGWAWRLYPSRICVALAGTGIHLFSFDLPAVETAIAVSVITLALCW